MLCLYLSEHKFQWWSFWLCLDDGNFKALNHQNIYNENFIINRIMDFGW